MRSALVALILTAGSLVAEEEKPIVCDLVPFHRSKDGSVYRLLVTNVSKETVLLAAMPRGSNLNVSWDRTDTYHSSGMASGPGWIYPASHGEITCKDGKRLRFRGEDIHKAIQHPTGSENSFCAIHPGMSISCEYPILDRKPKRAAFHFLERRGGKSTPIVVTWRANLPPVAAWLAATCHRVPEAETGRASLYEVPFSVFGNLDPDFPVVPSRRKIFEMKAWCRQNWLAEGDIDFAFYEPRTGLFLISTSEANHLKLKELQFETH